jgi:hypothetical protein
MALDASWIGREPDTRTLAATLSLRARRIAVHLGAAADKWWPTLLKGLPKLTAQS